MTASAGPGACGLVEVFDEAEISGWVDVAPGAGAAQVRLLVDGTEVATTWTGALVDRLASGQPRAFRFAVGELWAYLNPGNRLVVQYEATSLPIAGRGMFGTPAGTGDRSLAQLRARLAAGARLTRGGTLRTPRASDPGWQRAALQLYADLRAVLDEALGVETVLLYGTLLGAIRDGGFLGHDADFDCGYVSARRDAAAARELRDLALTLIDRGYAVHAAPAHLTISRPGSAGARVKLFHLYADDTGQLRCPFGIAGTGHLEAKHVVPAGEVVLSAWAVLVPSAPEAVLEMLYGPGWRRPEPAFAWDVDRVADAPDAHLNAAAIEEIYWADFYSRSTFIGGSTFFELLDAREGLPDRVLDIGCGDGRDSFAFAQAGRAAVTGLDRSHVGLRHARRRADELGLGDRLTFTVCDVSDAAALRAVVREARRSREPLLFYARFFLHSIPDDVQRTLLGVLADCAVSGDCLAAEFRTDRDELADKIHGAHYRRFQNGPAFGRALREVYRFVPVLEQEGNGFSPYRGEDPYLYRVIARRP